MTPSRAAIYVRKSTRGQRPSDPDQSRMCDDVVARIGATVVGRCADATSGAMHSDRPGLDRLLDDVRRGRIDLLVCESADRLTRESTIMASIVATLDRHGVRLATSIGDAAGVGAGRTAGSRFFR